MCPKKSLILANRMMPVSLAMVLVGIYIGFIDHEAWTLQAQVIAHISTMLGAGFLKLSYVMHLNASKQLAINDFQFRDSALSREQLPECCHNE